MEIIYDFNTIGIIFTAVVGGLSLLLVLPTVLFSVKRKQTNPGTVFYRVLDILLIVVLAVVWVAYVLCKVELFGFSLKPDNEALSFLDANGALFSIPYIGSLYGIFNSVLGTALLGVLSLLAVLSLILSFACRRKKRADASEEIAAQETAEPFTETAESDAIVAAEVVNDEEAGELLTAEPLVADTEEQPKYKLEPFSAMAMETGEDTVVETPEAENSEEDLIAVDVLEEEDFVPVEVLAEEPVFEAVVAEEEPPKELSPEVKDAIRTVVIGTPQSVKEALKLVVEEDAFIVKEILRVVVDTPTVEPAAAEAPVEEAHVASRLEELAQEMSSLDVTSAEPEISATAAEAEPVQIAQEDAFDRLLGEITGERVADAAPEFAAETTETEASVEPAGIVPLYAQVSNKTYSSSLRRPDTKKKSAATAAKTIA